MVGTVLGMIGAQNKAFATQRADRVQAQLDYDAANENQKQLAMSLKAGETNEATQLGSVRAAYGASGVQMNGTAALTLNSQAGIMQAKMAAESSASVLKTNTLYKQGFELAKEGDEAISQGMLSAGQQAFGGIFKAAASSS